MPDTFEVYLVDQHEQFGALLGRRRGPQLAHRPDVLGEPVVGDVLEVAHIVGQELDWNLAMLRRPPRVGAVRTVRGLARQD